MNKTFRIALVALATLFLYSCKNSVELVKRHYNNGYYIAVNKSKDRPKPQEITTPSQKPEEMTTITPVLLEEKSKQEAELKGSIHYAEAVSNPEHLNRESVNGIDKTTESTTSKELTRTTSVRQYTDENKPSANNTATDADIMLVLLVLLAIFIPPLAVYLKDDSMDKWFWVTLLLCIFASIFWWGPLGFGYLGWLWLAAVIIALLKVFDKL